MYILTCINIIMSIHHTYVHTDIYKYTHTARAHTHLIHAYICAYLHKCMQTYQLPTFTFSWFRPNAVFRVWKAPVKHQVQYLGNTWSVERPYCCIHLNCSCLLKKTLHRGTHTHSQAHTHKHRQMHTRR